MDLAVQEPINEYSWQSTNINIKDKLNLTIKEAVAYSNIGKSKIRNL